MDEAWDTARIREAFIYDGGEAEYHDPEHGAQTQRQVAGEIFDRWLAAHDAEVRAGVVAEEPEWEYGVRLHQPLATGGSVVPTTSHRTLEAAERMADLNPRYIPTYFRRRKAGPWVPVEQEGAGHERLVDG